MSSKTPIAHERSSNAGYFESDPSLKDRPRQARLTDGTSEESENSYFYPSQQTSKKREVSGQSGKSQNFDTEANEPGPNANRPDRDRKLFSQLKQFLLFTFLALWWLVKIASIKLVLKILFKTQSFTKGRKEIFKNICIP